MAYVLVLQCTCAYSTIEIQALRTVFECHPEWACLHARDDFTALTACTKSARGTLAFQLFIGIFLHGFYHRKAVYAVMASFKLPRAKPSRHTDRWWARIMHALRQSLKAGRPHKGPKQFPYRWPHLQPIHTYLGSARNSWQTTIMKNNMDKRVRTEDRLRSHKRSQRCSALMRQQQPKKPVTSIARPICKKYAMLFAIFENTDYTESMICALEKRAVVQGLRFVSKKIFNVTGLCCELVNWVLVA